MHIASEKFNNKFNHNSLIFKRFINYSIMSDQNSTTQPGASQQPTDNMDALMAAMLTKKSDVSQAVKAEDIPLGGGMDYSLIFFEPQVGKSYTLKLLRNLEATTLAGNNDIIHRKVYKNLPDPTRRGKTFQSVSSNNAKTDKVLDLFFELHNLKKAGDALATLKIDEILGVTNQGCCAVQVLESPDADQIGIVRLFTFSTFGPNATIANLIDEKLNPSEAKQKQGFEKEDIFDPFGSTALFIQCDEATYEDRKGRDFTKSAFTKNVRGPWVKLEDGTEHVFSQADKNEDGTLKPEVLPYFKALIALMTRPEMSIHNYFAYKAVNDPKNTEDTNKYLLDLALKIDEIIPVIRNAKSIAEIKNYGVVSSSAESGDSAQTISGASAADILKNSAPTELAGSILASGTQPAQTQQTAPVAETPAPVQAAPVAENAAAPTAETQAAVPAQPVADIATKSPEVEDILNS
jgi:hypothetical protein